jgi:hypothetical protein
MHGAAVPAQSQRCLGAVVTLQDVAEVCSASAAFLGFSLKPLKLRQAPGNFKIRRALAAVARCVRKSKIVLSVEAVLGQRIDMVDIKLALVQHEVQLLFADETPAGLAVMESPFELLPLPFCEAGQVLYGLANFEALVT